MPSWSGLVIEKTDWALPPDHIDLESFHAFYFFFAKTDYGGLDCQYIGEHLGRTSPLQGRIVMETFLPEMFVLADFLLICVSDIHFYQILCLLKLF